MVNHFMAKSSPRETIREHTQLLLDNYQKLKSQLKNSNIDWEVLRLAVLFHDLGKMNPKFQNKLYKILNIPLLTDSFPNSQEIPHGNLSIAFLDLKKLIKKYSEEDLKILYQSIYYHHPRYVDDFNYLKEYIDKELKPLAALFDTEEKFYRTDLKLDFLEFISKQERIDYISGKQLFYHYVLVKGLLNRLDYAASVHIDVEQKNNDLFEKTNRFLIQKGGLREIQEYLSKKQEENNVIVASTGIGKTEAGLLWIGNNKGFFTLPLRVSINAIYDRIKGKENIGFEEVALLHSDALSYIIKNEEMDDYLSAYTRSRQLSAPLTITTIDQLFKFVFKEEGFERILATLSYSKIIIDEIQMYSPEIVACILMGLKYLSEIGSKFTILTATFPAILQKFMNDMGIDHNYREYILDMNRHRIKVLNDSIETTIGEIRTKSQTSKVLVIVNTVKKAQAIYQELGDEIDKHLLHSRFIRKDRSELEKKLMEFSDEKDKCGVWITTQVVEASLDVDFDYLYTELSTIDGLFQRMGRCYRKRELEDDIVNINIFTLASGVGRIIDRDIFELSREALVKFDGKKVSELDKLEIIKDVYSLDKIKTTEYYRTIKKRIELLNNIPAYEFDRKEVDKKFRNIQSITAIPFSIYNENRKLIEDSIEEIASRNFPGKERIIKIKLTENIKELTVDIPYYLNKYVVSQKIPDKHTIFHIVKLKYDKFLGLLNSQEDMENIQ